MPAYDFECQKCSHVWEDRIPMSDKACPRCPECDSRDTMKIFTTVPLMRMPDAGWESENGGRGRYISQAATGLNDPKAYFRSRGEVKEACRRRGLRSQDA